MARPHLHNTLGDGYGKFKLHTGYMDSRWAVDELAISQANR